MIALAVPLILITGNLNPQEKLSKKEMEAYTELAKPGEEHKLLESLVGTWNQELKIWPEPGKDPMVASGIAEGKMILGGRFLTTTSTSGEGDMKTEGLYILGFDRRHKEFIMVGFDTWGTYYVTARGTYDKSTKSITMYGEDENPIMGVTQKFDMIIRILSPDKNVWEVVFKDFRTPGEKEFKMVEVIQTRKKK
jgi:hypothetical protein